MLNQFNFTDTYDSEKLHILRQMNEQIEIMAVKLDQIVSHVEEVHFKLPPKTANQIVQLPALSTYNSVKSNHQENRINSLNTTKDNHVLVTINNDQLINNFKQDKTSPISKKTNKKSKSNLNGKNKSSQAVITSAITDQTKPKPPDTTAKRNKQQRQFNTFVRDSINQLLGSDFMRTHDVQDIDSQVMEMIRKEAVENYLPDNIRPRRAWHLAKASLRTLKRTLNNRKT